LKIGELGDLHPVQPDFPPQPPGAQGRGLPVIFHETDIVLVGVDAERPEGVEVKVEDLQGGGLHDYLELVIVLEPVGVFAVAAVGGTAGRLNVGHVPGLGPEDAEKSSGVKGAGTFFAIVGLLNDATLFCPIPLQREDQILKCQNSVPPQESVKVISSG